MHFKLRYLATLSFCITAMFYFGCHVQQPKVHLDEQVYIWQRQWTAENTAALVQSRQVFSALHVLAAQDFPKEGWVSAHVDFAALRQDGRPVIAVVRLDGQLPQLSDAEILSRTQQLIQSWQAQGLNLRGIEIDHDCGSLRLAEYAALLKKLRKAMPQQLQLSITAIPTWLGSPALDQVLASVDRSVLQVHAVQRVEKGLFDESLAEQWIAAYAKRTPHDFDIALPAYSVGVTSDEQVESEVALPVAGDRQELRVDPKQVVNLIQTLEQNHYPHLRGLIWFRLPLASDHRAWRWSTLQAVILQKPLQSQIHIDASLHQNIHGLYDISLRNSGNLDATLPEKLVIKGQGCTVGDGLAPYQISVQSDQLNFSQPETRKVQHVVPAQSALVIGWARCDQLNESVLVN